MTKSEIAVGAGFLLALTLAVAGLINAAIAAYVNSPSGSFQNLLDSFLWVSLLVPVVVILVGFVGVLWENL